MWLWYPGLFERKEPTARRCAHKRDRKKEEGGRTSESGKRYRKVGGSAGGRGRARRVEWSERERRGRGRERGGGKEKEGKREGGGGESVVNHSLVRGEVAGCRRLACPLEIGRGTDNHMPPAGDTPGGQAGVRELPHAEGDIDPLLNEVDVPIVQNDSISSSGWRARNSGKRGIRSTNGRGAPLKKRTRPNWRRAVQGAATRAGCASAGRSHLHAFMDLST